MALCDNISTLLIQFGIVKQHVLCCFKVKGKYGMQFAKMSRTTDRDVRYEDARRKDSRGKTALGGKGPQHGTYLDMFLFYKVINILCMQKWSPILYNHYLNSLVTHSPLEPKERTYVTF